MKKEVLERRAKINARQDDKKSEEDGEDRKDEEEREDGKI